MVKGTIGTVPSQQALLAFDAVVTAVVNAAARRRRHRGALCDCLCVTQQGPMTIIWWLLDKRARKRDSSLVSSLNIECLERERPLVVGAVVGVVLKTTQTKAGRSRRVEVLDPDGERKHNLKSNEFLSYNPVAIPKKLFTAGWLLLNGNFTWS
jgi:hypothetical protein